MFRKKVSNKTRCSEPGDGAPVDIRGSAARDCWAETLENMEPKDRSSGLYVAAFASGMLCLGSGIRFFDPSTYSILSKCYGALTIPAYLLGILVSHNVHGGSEIPYWGFAGLEWLLLGLLVRNIARAARKQ